MFKTLGNKELPSVNHAGSDGKILSRINISQYKELKLGNGSLYYRCAWHKEDGKTRI